VEPLVVADLSEQIGEAVIVAEILRGRAPVAGASSSRRL
jgi:hypothetical protein